MAERPNDDCDLLKQMAKGNEEAFGALYARYRRPIFRFAWHMSNNMTTAEEITQEVFMQLIRDSSRFDSSKGSVAAYLFGIARNLTRRDMEHSARELPIIDELFLSQEDQWTADIDLLTELSRTELIEQVRKAVQSLPYPYGEVLVLRDLEQMGHRETAELLQCSLGTVASRLHRARAMLRAKLLKLGCVK